MIVDDDELPSDVEETEQPELQKEKMPASTPTPKPDDKRIEEDPSEQPS